MARLLSRDLAVMVMYLWHRVLRWQLLGTCQSHSDLFADPLDPEQPLTQEWCHCTVHRLSQIVTQSVQFHRFMRRVTIRLTNDIIHSNFSCQKTIDHPFVRQWGEKSELSLVLLLFSPLGWDISLFTTHHLKTTDQVICDHRNIWKPIFSPPSKRYTLLRSCRKRRC